MNWAGARLRLFRPVLLVIILVSSGCMVTRFAPRLLSPGSPNGGALRGCTDVSVGLRPAQWWQCLDDAQLRLLIRGAPPPLRQSTEIASRYIALRAQQTALVLLAEREGLDRQLLIIARQRATVGAAPHPQIAAAEAQLAQTQADQAQTRATITALRDRLATLTGVPPGALDDLPGGAIPLPPSAPMTGDPAAAIMRRPDIRLAKRTLAAVRGARPERDAYRAAVLAALQDVHSAIDRYAAAQVAANQAQAQAEHARSIAALQDIRARAGTVAPGDALDADRQALDALQAEELARAAMTQSYVALARSLGAAAAR